MKNEREILIDLIHYLRKEAVYCMDGTEGYENWTKAMRSTAEITLTITEAELVHACKENQIVLPEDITDDDARLKELESYSKGENNV